MDGVEHVKGYMQIIMSAINLQAYLIFFCLGIKQSPMDFREISVEGSPFCSPSQILSTVLWNRNRYHLESTL